MRVSVPTDSILLTFNCDCAPGFPLPSKIAPPFQVVSQSRSAFTQKLHVLIDAIVYNHAPGAFAELQDLSNRDMG
jgi:hypothetical protein